MKRLFVVYFVMLLGGVMMMGGCSLSTPRSSTEKPAWVENPNRDGKRGAVGVASRTYDQKISTQRSIAISKGLDELAMQMGVEVSLVTGHDEEYVNGRRKKDRFRSIGKQKAKSVVKAHIEDMWKDPKTDELYVWLVVN